MNEKQYHPTDYYNDFHKAHLDDQVVAAKTNRVTVELQGFLTVADFESLLTVEGYKVIRELRIDPLALDTRTPA